MIFYVACIFGFIVMFKALPLVFANMISGPRAQSQVSVNDKEIQQLQLEVQKLKLEIEKDRI